MTELEKKLNLEKHVNILCGLLNKADIKEEMFMETDNPERYDWSTRGMPTATFSSICMDEKAYKYLKRNKLISTNVCWRCGEEPVSGKYVFTYQQTEHSICEVCYKKDQTLRGNLNPRTSSNSNCYIATVCYNDNNAPEVQILRNYRDEYLQNYLIGRKLVDIYYLISPYIARQMKGKKRFNKMVRVYLLDKIVYLIKK